ncbi:MAG: TIGR04219 family outer membrane beta-barrel protein [Pseudomonadales bacterium]
MKSPLWIPPATLLLSLAPLSIASDFGLFAGWHSWQQDYSGDVNSVESTINIDLESDLGFDDERNNVFYAAVEHPLPVLPNFKVQRTEMEISRDSTLQREIEFNSTTFPAGENIFTNVDLSHTDITAYWQPLQNWVTLGVGFTVRLYDSRISIESRTNTGLRAKEELEQRLPMAYGKALVEIPNTNFSIGAELQGVGYDGSNLIDTQLQVAYESIFGFGAALGWRSFRLDLEDIDDIDADIEVSGVYFGITYNF